ncbi:MAG: GNAT family N-acetyltransferase [bacterium]
MDIKKQKVSSGIRFSLCDNEKEIGHAWLYILSNDQHEQPFGFIEDVFVDEQYRGQGLGTKLIREMLREAKRKLCYKVILTSRNTKPGVHAFYNKFGFIDWGKEFRLPLE